MTGDFVPKHFADGRLTNGIAVVYTVTGATAIVRSFCLVNTSASVVTCTLYACFDGVNNRCITPKDLVLEAGAKFEDDSSITLEQGDTLLGVATTTGVVDFIIGGVEQQL